jgi:hypothetical protein
MPQIGGKPKVSKATKTPKKKKTSSTTKRHYTVVIGSNKHGLYVSSSPSSAARKAVSKLCATDKKRKVSFHIREITQGSEKKTYGPYLGYIEKLAKPIELKGRVIKYKIHVEKIREKTFTKKKMNIKGGLHPTCDNDKYSYNNLLTNLGVNKKTRNKYQMNTKPSELLVFKNPLLYEQTLHKELRNDTSLSNLQKKHIEIIITDDIPNNRLNIIKKQCKNYRKRQESLIEPLHNNDEKIYSYHFKNNTDLERIRMFNNQMIQKHKQDINEDILSKKLNKLREIIRQQKRSEIIQDNERNRTNNKRSMLHKISTHLGNTVGSSVKRLKATLGIKEKKD